MENLVKFMDKNFWKDKKVLITGFFGEHLAKDLLEKKTVVYDRAPIIRSDGTPLRDYLYIKDAVRGDFALAEQLDQELVVGRRSTLGQTQP
jgi:nucleoside-diphosphate-sugar epimerase